MRKIKEPALSLSSVNICGAKTRSGIPCQSHPANGYRRCRMHGGAKGSGAPKGNKNALKHGDYSKESIAERRAAMATLREAMLVLDYLDRAMASESAVFPTEKEMAALESIAKQPMPVLNWDP